MSIVNPPNKRVLAVRGPDGTWKTVPLILGGIMLSYLTDTRVERCLVIDAFDDVWATVRDQGFEGVACLGNRGTIDSTVAFYIGASNGLPSDDIRTIVVDRDNELWVGTANGIAIVLDPSNPLRPGGMARYHPLSGQVINTIAIDSLNQKWVGTTQGVSLLSSDGTLLLASYTVENTEGKLINNDVKSIAIDQTIGAVYFGTPSGLACLTTAETKVHEQRTVPNQVLLCQSYPNPFNPSTTIKFELPKTSQAKLTVYDILGREVAVLVNERKNAGSYEVQFNGRNLSSGVYFYRIHAGNFSQTKKLLLVL